MFVCVPTVHNVWLHLPAGKCFRMVPEFAGAVGAAARIFELVDHRCEVNYCGGAVLPAVRGDLIFHDVSFRYEGRPDMSVLRGLSLHVAAGTTMALVGTSGNGKSTIIDLIQRMYDPCSYTNVLPGKVTLDGHDLRQLEPRWLRRQLGVVRQEPSLFAGTISENICYGLVEDASTVGGHSWMEQVEHALREANAWDFVRALPNGVETQIGERGVTLSGGQRQRIAIARALIRKPSILLLDEATSALDSESEGVVQAALTRAAAAGRTTVMVAHRLSTVEGADLIVVLESGSVAEMGSHAELMAQGSAGSRYATLVAKQHATADG
jgi:ABC-type multidrug transport system fused ATPase/permease subunit